MSKNIFKKIDSSLASYSPRTRFDRSKHHLTSVNAGRLYPIYLEECLPGDTWQMDLHSLVRMQTPIAPIMDDIYGDYYFFFVPYRLLDDNFEKVITISNWEGSTSTLLETFSLHDNNRVGRVFSNSVLHYLGLPLGDYGPTFNNKIITAPLKAYTMVWNDFFRDENYQSMNSVDKVIYSGGETAAFDNWLTTHFVHFNSCCAPVNERHDLFTSVLPSPQKGEAVLLPLGDSLTIPGTAGVPIDFNMSGSATLQTDYDVYVRKIGGTGTLPIETALYGDIDGNKSPITAKVDIPSRVLDLGSATAATINNLREAIVMQHFLETLARTGSRYTEYLKGFWGVNAPDARLQRPEFIAEWHTNINVSEVVQTAGLDEASGTTLGSTGAVSRTGTSKNGLFTYSCVEHGFLMGFYVVRHKLSYSQGISNMWFRTKGTDFYNPVFNGLGETPVYKRSILAPVGYVANLMKDAYSTAGSSVLLDDILGYNEAWSEYKFTHNQTSALLNPVAKEGLDYWTLTKAFTTSSITGSDVRVANDATLDRALSIENQDQFICDFYFDVKCTRRMPLRSTPGVNRI